MTLLPVPPDIEVIVGRYLRADPAVDSVVDSRIGSKHPSVTTQPWVRLILIDDTQAPASSVLHLVTAHLQLDCYAGSGGNTQASLIARTVRAALADMPNVEHDDAVIAHVRTNLRRLPDPDFAPARERYIVTADVTWHPILSAAS